MNNRLKVLRAERDWSQADLAERLGVSRQTVNALETGRYDPSCRWPSASPASSTSRSKPSSSPNDVPIRPLSPTMDLT
jgi:hypothetical protein